MSPINRNSLKKNSSCPGAQRAPGLVVWAHQGSRHRPRELILPQDSPPSHTLSGLRPSPCRRQLAPVNQAPKGPDFPSQTAVSAPKIWGFPQILSFSSPQNIGAPPQYFVLFRPHFEVFLTMKMGPSAPFFMVNATSKWYLIPLEIRAQAP